jgi:cephalosporin-C deacetylase
MEVPSGRGDFILPGYLTRFGYASLCLFPRGQGESKHEWVLEGDTGKLEFRLLHNITDPDKYYYRYADADCFRGLDFLESRPEIDGTRLAAWGASQGGGFSLTTASLDSRIKTCIARLPWMCDMVAYSMWDKAPRDELYNYLTRNPQHREAAMETLAYFDNLNLVDRITCPTLVSGARLDPVHPYHTVKSVFDKIPPLKSILVYRDASGPEAGACNADFNRHAMDWLERYLR